MTTSTGASASAGTPRRHRLADADSGEIPWRDWGPYVAERAWGTVREDYSATATPGTSSRTTTPGRASTAGTRTAWPASATSRRTGCFALGLWNGVDPILKERMFGLTGREGNHGEDVKDYWWYLDGTPTHSWHDVALPLSAGRVPVRGPGRRERTAEPRPSRSTSSSTPASSTTSATGIVDGRLREGRPGRPAHARHGRRTPGREEATLHVLPHALVPQHLVVGLRRPRAGAMLHAEGRRVIGAHSRAGALVLSGGRRSDAAVLRQRDQHAAPVRWRQRRVAVPEGRHQRPRRRRRRRRSTRTSAGTKAALDYVLTVPAGQSRTIRVRLIAARHAAAAADRRRDRVRRGGRRAQGGGRRVLRRRCTPASIAADEAHGRCGRPSPACCGRSSSTTTTSPAGWTATRAAGAAARARAAIRNGEWRHLDNHDVMLDAGHRGSTPGTPRGTSRSTASRWPTSIPTSPRSQLILLLREWYMHPNGQLPAYEWNFSDVNPPVHAWAALAGVRSLDGRAPTSPSSTGSSTSC